MPFNTRRRKRCTHRRGAWPFEVLDFLPQGLRFLSPSGLLEQAAQPIQKIPPVLHIWDGEPLLQDLLGPRRIVLPVRDTKGVSVSPADPPPSPAGRLLEPLAIKLLGPVCHTEEK